MGGLLDLYRDAMFWLFPVGTTLVGTVAFAVFAAPLTWIAWRDPPSLRKYRIQERRMPASKIVVPSLVAWAGNLALALVAVVLAWPLLRHTGIHAGPLPPWWVMAGQLVAFVYLDDLGFYWMHRLLHVGWLYKKIHAVHHRQWAPWACGGNYMHPVEFLLIVTLALVWPVAIGAHVATVWAWIVLRQWEAAEGHSGYSFPWNPSYLFPGYGGTEYHDFHHAKFVGNYAGFLGYLDRWFGTYSKGYREHLAVRAARRAAAGSGEERA